MNTQCTKWFATLLAYVTPNPLLAAAPHEIKNKTVLSLTGKKGAPWQMHRSRNEVLPRLRAVALSDKSLSARPNACGRREAVAREYESTYQRRFFFRARPPCTLTAAALMKHQQRCKTCLRCSGPFYWCTFSARLIAKNILIVNNNCRSFCHHIKLLHTPSFIKQAS